MTVMTDATEAMTGMIPMMATTGMMNRASQIGNRQRAAPAPRRRKARRAKAAKPRVGKLTKSELDELSADLAARLKKAKAKQEATAKVTKTAKTKNLFRSGTKTTSKRVKVLKPKRKKRSRIVGG